MSLRMATECWERIKDNLEDRSVLELGSVEDGTLAELESEQIEIIEEYLNLRVAQALSFILPTPPSNAGPSSPEDPSRPPS